MVKVGKRVRGAAIGTGLTAVTIIGIIFLAQRFGVGSKIIEGFGGLGSTIGEAPLAFVKELARSAGELGEESRKISENFQRATLGGLLGSELKQFGGGGFVGGTATPETLLNTGGTDLPTFLSNAFSVFGKGDSGDQVPRTSIFNVSSAFSTGAQARRLQSTTNANTVSGFINRFGTSRDTSSGGFGGFGDALKQEQALQEAIAASRAIYGEYFNR